MGFFEILLGGVEEDSIWAIGLKQQWVSVKAES
jgi:hypothetical protein